jgi:NADPH-dependent 2,4-dienoyl-CoA reductase/sulfur reductase-like enzyme
MAAAVKAEESGARVTVIERDNEFGGILNQCIHPGFGLEYFGEELTGPEYAHRFREKLTNRNICLLPRTTAIGFDSDALTCAGGDGVIQVRSKATVLAMGCRERTRFNLMIPGQRPAGVYTAGLAQRLLNIQGKLVGKRIVVLGSGDIGMIMARRLTLEGAKVEAVVEIEPYLTGLLRNKVQCLDDFSIPLMYSHTVTDIDGLDRVESVTVSSVDEYRRPIRQNSRRIECDTLLLSVGLIPENEISKDRQVPLDPLTKGPVVNQFMQTDIPAVFACGNVLHVNDLVDNVSRESETAGKNAAAYAAGKLPAGKALRILPGANVRYVCPQKIVSAGKEDFNIFFRAARPALDVTLKAQCEGSILSSQRVHGVNPGEMNYLTVPGRAIASLGSGITVSVD